MRARPKRLDRLPQQYFVALLGRVAAAAAAGGPTLVDLGRGNPEVGPPPHVVEALAESATRADVHGYAPIRGLARTKEALAGRYRDVYGVELDPEREIAVVPGTKTAITELALSLADEGDRILLPGSVLPRLPVRAGARRGAPGDGAASSRSTAGRPTSTRRPPRPRSTSTIRRTRARSARLRAPSRPRSAGPSAPAARSCTTPRTSTSSSTGAARRAFSPRRARRTSGVEMWSMSKTYGMAGWRIGFVVGNAEIVERINLLNDHNRVGIFEPLQRAAIAALEGPQDSVESRVADYERRRDAIAAVLPEPPVCEGTFFVWFRLPDGLTAERLLEEHRVAVAPGEGFGPSGAGWARLSLAVDDETIELGVERLQHAFAGVVA